MRTEPREFGLRSRSRRSPRPQGNSASVISASNLQIVDAAFADLETITLRRDKPTGTPAENKLQLPYEGIVQELAGQLRALDEQRRHLTRLLNDLQTPVSTAV